jgi:glycosyltransferase involved in cell wall biosynthesis
MSTVLSIMDRAEWGADTDNIVVADPAQRTLLWVPRDLWCEGFGDRINRAFANRRHDGLLWALAEHGITADHSLCIRREAVERALANLSISVPVTERLDFWYPVEPARPIEEGRKLVAFEPPNERLDGERIHQWIGARYEPDGRRPLLHTSDYARMRRQQVLLRRLLEEGFEFMAVLADPQLVSASGPEAREELSLVDRSWRFSMLEDVRNAVRDDKMVLERTASPAISVVVCSYRSRERIDHALGSLRRQDLDEPWEVIVVDSGDDDAADYVACAYPEVTLVRSARRLYPAAARNAGVRAARGRFVAFLPDDGVAEPDWVRRRLQRHREGHAAVGGAITNGTPWRPVGTASYFLEYSALLPSERILREQQIPHCLSYERELVQRVGGFPEELETGEDTVLNARLLGRGATVGLDAQIRLAHVNLTSMRAYIRHHYVHGRGLMECVGQYGHRSPAAPSGDGTLDALVAMFIRYPALRWARALLRIARGRPRSLPAYLALTPLVWIGLWATSLGAWSQWQLDRSIGRLAGPA